MFFKYISFIQIIPDINALRSLIFVTIDSDTKYVLYYYLNIITYSTLKNYFYHYIIITCFVILILFTLLHCFVLLYFSNSI